MFHPILLLINFVIVDEYKVRILPADALAQEEQDGLVSQQVPEGEVVSA